MAEDQQGPNKRVTSPPCSSPPPPLLSHLPLQCHHTQSHNWGHTGPCGWLQYEREGGEQLLLAKPVYTDGGKLHYFWEGRGGGGEGGGLVEFTKVVYNLKEGRR